MSVRLQVTKANFQQSFPIIKEALQECQFFAFDCEMTGLDTAESKQEYLDEIEDRYHYVRLNLHNLHHTCSIITGVCCKTSIEILHLSCFPSELCLSKIQELKTVKTTVRVRLFPEMCLLQTANGGTQFALTQVGLSAFVWSETEHQYRPRTFNFYLFPKPVNGYDRRFLSQVSFAHLVSGL